VTAPIDFDRALEIVLDSVPAAQPATLSIMDSVGLPLSADVVADRDAPPFDSSAMDGYAVRAADAIEGASLNVVGEIAAGGWPDRSVGAGEAIAIMTGAPVPEGADAIVPVEVIERGEGTIRVLAAAKDGAHLRRRGEIRAAGETVLRAGHVVRPIDAAILGSVGQARVPVFARPYLAVGATGNELVPVEVPPERGEIRNSNTPTLMAQAREAGALATTLGIIRDDPAETRKAIAHGLEREFLVLSGGVSMGEYDHVVGALEEEGVEILFHKVAMKPGKPIAFGRRGRTLVFGLPGNPVSASVGFELFVRPAIRKRLGFADPVRAVVTAKAGERLRGSGPRRAFLPATWDAVAGTARPVRWRGSHDPYAFAAANALIVVPENGDVEAGADVAVFPLGNASAAAP